MSTPFIEQMAHEALKDALWDGRRRRFVRWLTGKASGCCRSPKSPQRSTAKNATASACGRYRSAALSGVWTSVRNLRS